MKIRGFEVVRDECRKNDGEIILPKRGTKYSAGYDVYLPCDISLEPNEKKMIFTDVKAYMMNDEVLLGYIRSSLGIKHGVVLSNGTSVIDSDYYGNEWNDGNIGLPLWNTSDKRVEFKRGDRIGQMIFTKYYISDNDDTNKQRTGGFGSTEE